MPKRKLLNPNPTPGGPLEGGEPVENQSASVPEPDDSALSRLPPVGAAAPGEGKPGKGRRKSRAEVRSAKEMEAEEARARKAAILASVQLPPALFTAGWDAISGLLTLASRKRIDFSLTRPENAQLCAVTEPWVKTAAGDWFLTFMEQRPELAALLLTASAIYLGKLLNPRPVAPAAPAEAGAPAEDQRDDFRNERVREDPLNASLPEAT